MTQKELSSERRRRLMIGIGAGIVGAGTGVGSVAGATQQADTAVIFEVPTVEQPGTDGVESALDFVENELGVRPSGTATDEGARITASAETLRGESFLLHPTLDVVESFLQNEFGQPGEGSVKSTLRTSGDGLTLQPSIELDVALGQAEAEEIEELAAFVLGVSVAVDAEETANGVRLFVDTGGQALGHGTLDVIEIVARRIAEREGAAVLDDDAHPVVARPAVTDGLGANSEAGGPISGTAGNPTDPYPKNGPADITDIAVDRPTTGETGIAFHTTTGVAPSEEDVGTFVGIVEDETGVSIEGTATDTGVLYEVPDTEFVHPVLDVAESATANTLGKPDVEGTVKSTLLVSGDAPETTLQLGFELSEPFGDTVVSEIERLYEFVAGVTATGYHEGDTFYLDTGGQSFDHLAVDVGEILVRRFAAATGVAVESGFNHSIAAREQVQTQLTFEVPTVESVPAGALGDLRSAIETETGAQPAVEQTASGVRVRADADVGGGQGVLLHPVLDVAESFLQNEFGQPGEGIVKSTLAVSGAADGTSVQPCMILSDTFDDAVLDEFERLFEFVAGYESNAYFNENRFYVDTGEQTLGHIALDVAEILTRRLAESEGLGVESGFNHSVKVLDQQAGDAGKVSRNTPTPTVTDIDFPRPTDGAPRAAFHTPTGVTASTSDVEGILDAVEGETGLRPAGSATDNGVLFEFAETAFLHPVLDVAESATQNTLGKPDVQGSVKSTLFAAGDADGLSVQPAFQLSAPFADEQTAEIERLFRFVAGVDADVYVEDSTVYVDSGAQAFGHLGLDVAEILVRRFADDAELTGEIDITDGAAHSIEIPGAESQSNTGSGNGDDTGDGDSGNDAGNDDNGGDGGAGDDSQSDSSENGNSDTGGSNSDGSGPGFGVGGAVAGLAGAGYLLKQRLTNDRENGE
jgi:hypothetical protein